jgi:IclR family acetate operon transcriptional repressor
MDSQRNQSYALRHALAIIDALAEFRDGHGASLKDLVQRTGLNKSTILRLMTPLLEKHIATRDPEAGTYRLGWHVLEWAEAYLSGAELARLAAPHLRTLVERTGETAFLVVYEDGDVVYLSKVESPNKIRMSSNIGTRTPAYSTANGKAILAFLPDTELDRVIARGLRPLTPYTVTDADALREQLAMVRLHRYAFDDRENVVDARCVGAPVFDFRGQVVGGISLAGPAYRMEVERINELGRLVADVADAISAELGAPSRILAPAPATSGLPEA